MYCRRETIPFWFSANSHQVDRGLDLELQVLSALFILCFMCPRFSAHIETSFLPPWLLGASTLAEGDLGDRDPDWLPSKSHYFRDVL